MKATEISEELPEKNSQEREDKIINFVGLGHYLCTMSKITSEWNGHLATIEVMSDALMLGEPDDFLRINATMEGQQRIADLLILSMMTSKISDLVYFNAKVRIEPQTQSPDSNMSNTSRMLKHSQAVTKAILDSVNGASIEDVGSGRVGLVADVGKDWILSNKLFGKKSVAANYGWHTKLKSSSSGPFKCQGGGSIWQNTGTVHNTKHVDYSQVVRLMSQTMTVDGKEMSFRQVATDPELCGLVSYEGPLKVFRHPDVLNPADNGLVC